MLWNRQTGALISQFGLKSGQIGFSLSPHRKLMVMGRGEQGEVQVAEAPAGTVLNRLWGAKEIWCSAVGPHGDRVAVGDELGKVYVWDRASAKLLWAHSVGEGAVRGLAISTDGKTLAVGRNSPWLQFYETDTGMETARQHHPGCVGCAFTSDGRRLVSAGGTEIVILDVPTSQVVQRFEQRPPLMDVVIRRQGEADLNVQRFEPLPSQIDAMALAPDEKHLATGSYDGMIGWWDMTTGAELHRWVAHPGGVLGLDISPDGRELLSSGKDGTVRLWRLPEPPAKNFSAH
jgi:WD40 repeat protein